MSINDFNSMYKQRSPTMGGYTYVGDGSSVELRKVNERLDLIEKRLCVLYDNPELHEKFPALKEAYENYKLIEKLVTGGNNGVV
jgi:hypothetical protein